MGMQKVNLDLVRCDGFWQPDTAGDRIRGVVISANLVEDTKNKGKRRLYIIASTEKHPKKVFLDKKEVTLEEGQHIGINSSHKVDLGFKKLGGARKVCGHEIEIVFKGKEALESGNDLKQYEFQWDPDPSKKHRDKVVLPEEGWDREAVGTNAAGDDRVPFDLPPS